MIFFARGMNCVGRGAMGFGSASAETRRSAKSEPSAMEPSPRPHRLKKWRRVRCCNAELTGVFSDGMTRANLHLWTLRRHRLVRSDFKNRSDVDSPEK